MSMKHNFNLPLTALETGIYDNKHQHVATTTQSQDKAMALAVNSHDDLVAALEFTLSILFDNAITGDDLGKVCKLEKFIDKLKGDSK